MVFKVAVASNDGKYVNQHFGSSPQFLIFELNHQGEYKFLELRENKPACNVDGHTESAMVTSVKLIADCQAVIASQIGPGAIDVLLDNNVEPYIAPMFIDEALKELVSSLKKEDKL